MKIIELDLTGCEYLYDIHERIRIKFGFPEWYGRNWDAFWDMLRSECDANRVIIKGEHTLPEEFGDALSKMHSVLEDNMKFHKEHHLDDFSYEIIN